MNDPVFLGINQNFITEQIWYAKKSVFLAIPGLTKNISDTLIECSKRLGGWNDISVVIDPSPKVYYLGYAELGAFKELEKNGCNIKCERNLRIGLLIVDGQMFVFSPLSLNLESDEEGGDSVNAIALKEEVAKPIIEAVTPENGLNEPEIGKRGISEIEIKIVQNTITNNPPQKPDLTRKISVLTSQIQFVSLSFKGSRLKNTRISLNARELGIEDEDLVDRISGQYRVFEQLPQNYDKGIYYLKDKYRRLRERFTKTIGEYGTIVWISQSKEFEEALKILQCEIDEFNEKIVKEIVDEISKSKEKLKKFINENYRIANQQQGFNQKLVKIKKEKVIEDIIEKAFSAYTQKELEKNLELKYQYYNISSQMASDEGFSKKIEESLGITLDELVKFENVFGMDNGFLSF